MSHVRSRKPRTRACVKRVPSACHLHRMSVLSFQRILYIGAPVPGRCLLLCLRLLHRCRPPPRHAAVTTDAGLQADDVWIPTGPRKPQKAKVKTKAKVSIESVAPVFSITGRIFEARPPSPRRGFYRHDVESPVQSSSAHDADNILPLVQLP